MTPAPDTPLRVVESSDALAEAAAPPPAASAARRQPVTVALTVPIEAHGETRTSLTLRPPKVEDLEECDLLGSTRTTRTFSDLVVRLAGIPRSSVLQLDPSDYAECVKAAGAFLDKRAPTS
jgi:hypothetical protein